MMNLPFVKNIVGRIYAAGEAIFFLGDIFKVIFSGRVRLIKYYNKCIFREYNRLLLLFFRRYLRGLYLVCKEQLPCRDLVLENL